MHKWSREPIEVFQKFLFFFAHFAYGLMYVHFYTQTTLEWSFRLKQSASIKSKKQINTEKMTKKKNPKFKSLSIKLKRIQIINWSRLNNIYYVHTLFK